MDQRRLTTGSPLPALLVDRVASTVLSVFSARGRCIRPRVAVGGNFEDAHLGCAR